jgi:hypothetical protein
MAVRAAFGLAKLTLRFGLVPENDKAAARRTGSGFVLTLRMGSLAARWLQSLATTYSSTT